MLFLCDVIGSQNDRVFLFGSGYWSAVKRVQPSCVHTPSVWA